MLHGFVNRANCRFLHFYWLILPEITLYPAMASVILFQEDY